MEPSREGCRACPRQCGIVRSEEAVGYCGMPEEIHISRCAPHHWEEPPISGTRGSGTVFFTGCSLRCVYCQNAVISRERRGNAISADTLHDKIRELVSQGVHNINFVTPTHYAMTLIPVLKRLKEEISLPVVWNTGGYERVETLQALEGLVDIYLPDFKYMSSELASAYSGASDYGEVATRALMEMYRQVGDPVFDGNGMMMRGMVVRHLVLPGCRKDSLAVVRHLAEILPAGGFKLSLMRQYTPEFALHTPYRNLHRRVTDFEYTSVVEEALSLGIDGYIQGKDSASSKFTPDFESH